MMPEGGNRLPVLAVKTIRFDGSRHSAERKKDGRASAGMRSRAYRGEDADLAW